MNGGVSKWDSEAKDLAKDITSGSNSGGGRTIGTLIHHARKGGWDMPTPAPSTDGGTKAANPNTDTNANEDTDAPTLDFSPESVSVIAGLGEDGGVSDLDDRQKAACVWELVRQSETVHIRVRRENGSLWAYDTEAGIWNHEGERALLFDALTNSDCREWADY